MVRRAIFRVTCYMLVMGRICLHHKSDPRKAQKLAEPRPKVLKKFKVQLTKIQQNFMSSER